MKKEKEIQVEFNNDGFHISGQIFFVNEDLSRRFAISMILGPDEKVLKGKARVKADAPVRAAEWLAEHPGWKQCTREVFDAAQNRGLR